MRVTYTRLRNGQPAKGRVIQFIQGAQAAQAVVLRDAEMRNESGYRLDVVNVADLRVDPPNRM